MIEYGIFAVAAAVAVFILRGAWFMPYWLETDRNWKQGFSHPDSEKHDLPRQPTDAS